MKAKLNYVLVGLIFALLSFSACQDEISQTTNPNEQETIVSNSFLANLISQTTANYGGYDDILDSASCFSVNLPVTIVVNNITITIETEDDLEHLEDVLEAVSDNDNIIDFVFPITISFSDYSQIVINNENQLQNFIDNCTDDIDDYIECIDFIYPISFSVFNSSFNLIDNIVFENDEALYVFLNGLSDDDNALIVSINYPVSLIYAHGETVEVNSNQDLADAIEAAGDDCNAEVFDCFDDFELVACADDSGEAEFNLSANTIGLVICTEGYTASFHFLETEAETNTNPIVNTESYFSITSEIYLRIESDSGNFEIFSIFLNAEECESPFACFDSFEAKLEVCFTDAAVLYEFNLPLVFDNCNADAIYFYATVADAENGTNAFANASNYTTAELNSTVYARAEVNDQFQIVPIQLSVVNCNPNACTEGDVDNLLIDCIWNVTSFNGSDNLISFNFDFSENGTVIIYDDTSTIDAVWSTSSSNDFVRVEFSYVAGPNIQAINGNWLVVECTPDQLVFHDVNDSNNEFVLDKTCD